MTAPAMLPKPPLGPLTQPIPGAMISATGAIPGPGMQPITAGNILPPGPPGSTSFGPGNNLIGTQINPTAAPDTAAARTQLGSLTQDLGAQAPDRLAIAEGAMKTFDQNQADQSQLGVQDIGRNAAAAGRLGSGMVSTSLGDLQTQLDKSRLQEERGLAGEVAGQTLNDRLAAVSGTEGALGQLSGLDTEAQNALRGERGYQEGLDQQATENQVQQFGLEQGAQAQDFNQNFDTNQLLAQLGFGGDTNATLAGAAGTYGAEGQDLLGGAGNILTNYFQNQKPKPAGVAV